MDHHTQLWGFCLLKKKKMARRWWLTLVTLATWEAEIRRIVVQNQCGQIVLKTLSQKYPTQKRAGRVAQVVECMRPWVQTPVPPKKFLLNLKSTDLDIWGKTENVAGRVYNWDFLNVGVLFSFFRTCVPSVFCLLVMASVSSARKQSTGSWTRAFFQALDQCFSNGLLSVETRS
jgi:hypothetical protein